MIGAKQCADWLNVQSRKCRLRDFRSSARARTDCLRSVGTIAGGVVTRKKTSIVRIVKGYDAVLADVVSLIDAGRRASARTSGRGVVILRGAGWQILQTVSEKSRARRGFTRAPAQSPIVQGPLAQLAERPEAS